VVSGNSCEELLNGRGSILAIGQSSTNHSVMIVRTALHPVWGVYHLGEDVFEMIASNSNKKSEEDEFELALQMQPKHTHQGPFVIKLDSRLLDEGVGPHEESSTEQGWFVVRGSIALIEVGGFEFDLQLTNLYIPKIEQIDQQHQLDHHGHSLSSSTAWHRTGPVASLLVCGCQRW